MKAQSVSWQEFVGWAAWWCDLAALKAVRQLRDLHMKHGASVWDCVKPGAVRPGPVDVSAYDLRRCREVWLEFLVAQSGEGVS